MLLVRYPGEIQILGAHEALFGHPGLGEFSLPHDRSRAAPVTEALISGKLKACLAARDFHGFRVVLNIRSRVLQGLPVNIETACPTSSEGKM
jgi:hypothetical protein